MSAMRAVLLASLVLAPLGCKRTGSTVTPEPAPAEAQPTPRPPKPASPSEQLGALYFTHVSIDESLSVPGGFVVAFSYSAFDSRIGSFAADGIDIMEDFDAAVEECEQHRAELDEDERMLLEYEGRTCEEEATVAVLEDDQLDMECENLGVAYFDLEGTLLQEQLIGGSCSELVRFELRDLSPLPEPDVVLVASHGISGELTRGGWGTVESGTVLYVLAPWEQDGKPVLHELAQVDLDDDRDGGNCPYGTNRSLVLGEDGALELYSQGWNDCSDEGCIHPEDVDDQDEPVDPAELCVEDPVELERAQWSEDERQWGAFEPMEWEGDPVLPKSVLDEPSEQPAG